MIVLSAKITL